MEYGQQRRSSVTAQTEQSDMMLAAIVRNSQPTRPPKPIPTSRPMLSCAPSELRLNTVDTSPRLAQPCSARPLQHDVSSVFGMSS